MGHGKIDAIVRGIDRAVIASSRRNTKQEATVELGVG
jgi:hypothetical protein